MLDQEYYTNIFGQGRVELKKVRIENVANLAAQQDIEATGDFDGGPLNAENRGLQIYRVDLNKVGVWDGTQFQFGGSDIDGDVIFKGFIDASIPLDDPAQPQPVQAVSGYQYVVTTAGTLTLTGVTFSPSAVVEQGDLVLFSSSSAAQVFQRNDVKATETVFGNTRLASQQEVLNGDSNGDNAVVTAETLQAKLQQESVVRQYNSTINLLAITPTVVEHNLNLIDKDFFTVNAIRNGSTVNIAVTSIDENSIQVSSVIPVNGVKITVQGASAV